MNLKFGSTSLNAKQILCSSQNSLGISPDLKLARTYRIAKNENASSTGEILMICR